MLHLVGLATEWAMYLPLFLSTSYLACHCTYASFCQPTYLRGISSLVKLSLHDAWAFVLLVMGI
jgi:hypothetical protein